MSLTESLIKCVKKYPILYDKSNEDFNKPLKRNLLWKSIGKQLKKNPETVRKKWQYIKDSYVKYLKASTANKGKAHLNKNYKKWRWANNMEEFRPFYTLSSERKRNSIAVTRTTRCKDSETEDKKLHIEYLELHDSNSEESLLEPLQKMPMVRIEQNKNVTAKNHPCNTSSSTSTAKVLGKRKRMDGIKTSNGLDNNNITLSNNVMDATDLLFLAHSRTIKWFSGKRQAITKMKIAEVIMQEEIHHQDELAAQLREDAVSN